jgi:hypothetical protein
MRQALFSWHYIKFGRDPVTRRPLHAREGAQLQSARYALLDFRDPLAFRGFTNLYSGRLQRGFLQQGGWRILQQADSVVMLERGTGSGDVSSLADIEPGSGRSATEQARLLPESPIYLAGSRIDPGQVQLAQSSRQHLLRVICHFVHWPRSGVKALPPDHLGLVAVFQVSDPAGAVIYRRAWPLTYTLYNLSEWPRYDGARGSFDTLRVTYPLLLPPATRPGRYTVELSLRRHPLDTPLCAAVLGAVTLQ